MFYFLVAAERFLSDKTAEFPQSIIINPKPLRCPDILLTQLKNCLTSIFRAKKLLSQLTRRPINTMKRYLLIAMLLLAAPLALGSPTQTKTPQEKEASRNATRERLRTLLDASGPKKGINISFRQSTAQPYNFVGVLREGLTNADSFEVVIGVTADETIGFRIYPHYKGGYINVNKARDSAGLMRQLLRLSDKNFLFWGMDDSTDIFAGYTFTLESGFPDRAIEIVLYSIRPLDKYVGDMRPTVDGSSGLPPAD